VSRDFLWLVPGSVRRSLIRRSLNSAATRVSNYFLFDDCNFCSPIKNDKTMKIVKITWSPDGSTLFGSATAGNGVVLYRLIVEELPKRTGWDWSVWRAGFGAAAIGSSALSSLIAIASAERTALAWGCRVTLRAAAASGTVGINVSGTWPFATIRRSCRRAQRTGSLVQLADLAMPGDIYPVRRVASCLTGCEFQASQKCLRLMSEYAINFMP
jgi:hypothetical protein